VLECWQADNQDCRAYQKRGRVICAVTSPYAARCQNPLRLPPAQPQQAEQQHPDLPFLPPRPAAFHYLYSKHLSHVRYLDLNIMEIGLGCFMKIGTGNSLKLWRAYLPCAKISFLEHMRWVSGDVAGCGGAGNALMRMCPCASQSVKPCRALRRGGHSQH
jgi:hypothetical protein